MNDIRSLLKVARHRLSLSSFIAVAHLVAIVVAAVALAMALADRAPAASFVSWVWVAPPLVLLAAGISLALWLRRRPSELEVALAVDERLDLREKLSTALHCHTRDDAFARAAVEDAVTTARDPKTRHAVTRRFAVTSPRQWWVSPLLVLATVGVLLLPQANLFAKEKVVSADLVDAQEQADDSVEALIKEIEDKPQLEAELTDLLGDLTAEGTDPEALKTPEQVKRDAIKKVTDLTRRLDDILNGEKGKTARVIEETLGKLKNPEDGPASELADALKKGDFTAAKEAIEKLAEQASKGEMDAEQMAKAAEQLQNLADQLEQLAQQQQQLEQALQQAGMDPALADNPQALQQALQQNQNLNQQQKQQLQQMMQAQQQAQQMCQGMGQACQAMAQALQNGQPGQAGQQMNGQLNQLEQMQMLLQQAQAAMNACQGQCQGLGQGINMNQAMQQWGGAFGGRGQGQGGKAPIAPTPTGTQMVKVDVNTVEGEIIARMLFEGPVTVGESRKSRSDVVAEVVEGYAEAQPEDQIPRIYEDAQMHYFGELERRSKAVEPPDPEASPETDGGGEEPSTDEPASGD